MARQVGQKLFNEIDGFLVRIGRIVDEAADPRVHPPATQVLFINRLVDRKRSDTRARYRHRRAFLHHDKI